MKLASVRVSCRDHKLVRAELSYYAGPWFYWAKRRGRYPGIAKEVTTALRKQGGKCFHCEKVIKEGPRLMMVAASDVDQQGRSRFLVHTTCIDSSDKEGGNGSIESAP